jgi:hypothetical protein
VFCSTAPCRQICKPTDISEENCLTLKNEALRSSEASVTMHELTWRKIPEVLDLLRYSSKKFKSRTTDFFTQDVNSENELSSCNKNWPGDWNYKSNGSRALRNYFNWSSGSATSNIPCYFMPFARPKIRRRFRS